MFKTCLVVLLSLVFFSWILPLGVFIKPSQEKMACNGQRAICLCSHGKSLTKALEGTLNFKGGIATPKEHTSSGGTNHFYTSTTALMNQNPLFAGYFNLQYLAYKTPFLSSLEHVPKALFS